MPETELAGVATTYLESDLTNQYAGFDEGRMILEERFCHDLHVWDRHVDACRACLSMGAGLCDQGARLAEQVRRERASIELYETPPAAEPMEDLELPLSLPRRVWIAWASFIAPSALV